MIENDQYKFVSKIKSQFDSIGLILNSDKTQMITVVKKKQSAKMDTGQNITNQLTILGVVFDSNLSFNTYIRKTITSANKGLFYLRLSKQYLEKTDLVKLYNGIIRTKLEYANVLLCGMSKGHKKQLQQVQRRAHNVICHFSCHCKLLQNLNDRRDAQTIDFIKKINEPDNILHHLVPATFENKDIYRLPKVSTERAKNSFYFHAFKLYNQSKR